MIILCLIIIIAVAFILDQIRIHREMKHRHQESLSSRIAAIEKMTLSRDT